MVFLKSQIGLCSPLSHAETLLTKCKMEISMRKYNAARLISENFHPNRISLNSKFHGLNGCNLRLKSSVNFFKSVNREFRSFKRLKFQHNRLHYVLVFTVFLTNSRSKSNESPTKRLARNFHCQ